MLLETDFTGADLTGCLIYGASASDLKLDRTTTQLNLVVTRSNEPEVTADNIEVAQFVHRQIWTAVRRVGARLLP
jgi:hypothetical protein